MNIEQIKALPAEQQKQIEQMIKDNEVWYPDVERVKYIADYDGQVEKATTTEVRTNAAKRGNGAATTEEAQSILNLEYLPKLINAKIRELHREQGATRETWWQVRIQNELAAPMLSRADHAPGLLFTTKENAELIAKMINEGKLGGIKL